MGVWVCVGGQFTANIRFYEYNYVAQKLPKQTYHHSWRVFYYGWAIKEQHFPSWAFTAETYLLSCLLHDIGTTDENLNATMMSFEWYGAFLARDLVMQQGGQKELAESVCEAITRHQDLRTVGNITAVGQLLQLATIFGKFVGHVVYEQS